MMGSLGPRRQPSRGGRGGAVTSVDVDAVVGERVSGSGKEEATNDRLLICNGGVDGGGGVLFSIQNKGEEERGEGEKCIVDDVTRYMKVNKK